MTSKFYDGENHIFYNENGDDVFIKSQEGQDLNISLTSLNFKAGTQKDFIIDDTTGWFDITSDIVIRGTGSLNPAWSQFRDTFFSYEFNTTNTRECFNVIHIPHSYSATLNSGVFFHAHCSTNSLTPTGNFKLYFDYTYASSTGVFSATQTTSVVSTITSQYQHIVAEIPSPVLAGALEVDGIIYLRTYRNPNDVEDTANYPIFIFTIDAHIQIDKTTTKYRNKATTGSFYN